MTKGCFIVFEGIDGAGKSEQFSRLVKNLKKENYNVTQSKEPTPNQPIGKLIREILYESKKVSEEAMALLFAADRADHTTRKIKPALINGSVVICDRYLHSSLAYQGKDMTQELDLKWIMNINKFAIQPDVVIFLDISPEIGQDRLTSGQKRVQDHTYFEDKIQQEKIRSAYYKVFGFEERNLFDYTSIKEKNDTKIVHLGNTIVLRIDGTRSQDEIEKLVQKNVLEILIEKKVSKIETNQFKQTIMF